MELPDEAPSLDQQSAQSSANILNTYKIYKKRLRQVAKLSFRDTILANLGNPGPKINQTAI